jgi:hypothetical protein
VRGGKHTIRVLGSHWSGTTMLRIEERRRTHQKPIRRSKRRPIATHHESTREVYRREMIANRFIVVRTGEAHPSLSPM